MTQEPVQTGANAASDDDKVDGIVAQMRADIAQGNVKDVADALRQRLADADLELDDKQFAQALAAVTA